MWYRSHTRSILLQTFHDYRSVEMICQRPVTILQGPNGFPCSKLQARGNFVSRCLPWHPKLFCLNNLKLEASQPYMIDPRPIIRVIPYEQEQSNCPNSLLDSERANHSGRIVIYPVYKGPFHQLDRDPRLSFGLPIHKNWPRPFMVSSQNPSSGGISKAWETSEFVIMIEHP